MKSERAKQPYIENVDPTPTLRHQRRSCRAFARLIYRPRLGFDQIFAPNRADYKKLWSRQVSLLFSQGKWPKFSRFSTYHFSAVSTNFWILSSRSVNIRPNLGAEPSNLRKFDEKIILKFVTKSENSDFVVKFRARKRIQKKNLKSILGTSRRVLTDLEENFQKFVVTAENGPLQISLIFIKISCFFIIKSNKNTNWNLMLIKTTPAKMNEVLPYGSTSAENRPKISILNS